MRALRAGAVGSLPSRRNPDASDALDQSRRLGLAPYILVIVGTETTSECMSVVVVDDHRLTAMGIADSLRARHITVSATAHSVADAVRHGGADWVEISLQPSGKHSLLTVVNNGTFQEIAGPGLGSARLDQWAPGAWSRQVDVMGFARLRVQLSH